MLIGTTWGECINSCIIIRGYANNKKICIYIQAKIKYRQYRIFKFKINSVIIAFNYTKLRQTRYFTIPCQYFWGRYRKPYQKAYGTYFLAKMNAREILIFWAEVGFVIILVHRPLELNIIINFIIIETILTNFRKLLWFELYFELSTVLEDNRQQLSLFSFERIQTYLIMLKGANRVDAYMWWYQKN